MKPTVVLALSVLALAACAADTPPTPPPPLFGGAAPSTPPAPAAAPAVAAAPSPAVVGVWQGTVRDRSRRGGQMQTWRLEFNPDGTYRSTSAFAQGGQVQHWGRYVTGDGFIRMALEGWEPRQECGSAGCYPLQMPPTDTVVLVALDGQQMVTEQGPLLRLQ
ncbi:MAG: hypothetical protein JNL66_00075 [Alphaproteobacteria bacterium]|nr:hypothetical protein [Alphaproteobacteria bacterium]